MYGRGTLLAFCVLSISLSYCQPQVLVVTSDLDLGSSTVRATAECGRNANGEPVETEFCTSASSCESCNAGESERSYPALAAVDGSAATSWQSPPLSAGEEFTAVNFTLELGQVCIWLYSWLLMHLLWFQTGVLYVKFVFLTFQVLEFLGTWIIVSAR